MLSFTQVDLTVQEKEQYLNVARWFDHIQHIPSLRHHLPPVVVLRNRIYTSRHHWDSTWATFLQSSPDRLVSSLLSLGPGHQSTYFQEHIGYVVSILCNSVISFCCCFVVDSNKWLLVYPPKRMSVTLNLYFHVGKKKFDIGVEHWILPVVWEWWHGKSHSLLVFEGKLCWVFSKGKLFTLWCSAANLVKRCSYLWIECSV